MHLKLITAAFAAAVFALPVFAEELPPDDGVAVAALTAAPPSQPVFDGPITPHELADLIPPEEMTAETDLRPYLREGVPPELRNAALRQAWQLNPAIRDYVDPALDYQ